MPNSTRPSLLLFACATALAALAPGAASRADRGDESMTTRVADVADGVVVTVAAPRDPVAQQEIGRRVQKQLELADRPERGAIEHTGLGAGSGRYGSCPGMLEHTSLSVEWTTDGATMTIRSERAADVRRLQTITHRRARALETRLREAGARS